MEMIIDAMTDTVIDTHTHYVHKKFDCGRKEILEGLANEGIVAVIEAAIDYDSNGKMRALCRQYPFVYMAAGCHPNCVAEMDPQKMHSISAMLSEDKVVAIGETGLDYKHAATQEEKELQKQWFRKFINLSIESNKPLVIHCREAYEDLISILKEFRLNTNPGVVHCFSGNKEQADALNEMGFYFGIGGKFTQESADLEMLSAIRQIPMEKILLETDAPYLVPKGAGGQRNTSANLKYIVKELALLRERNPEEILEMVLENTKAVYPKLFA